MPPEGDSPRVMILMEMSQFLLSLALILLAAKVGGRTAERFHQPAVVGELIGGMLIGTHVLGLVRETEPLHLLAEIGAIFLLFEVGLETDLDEFLQVGKSAFLVAIIGVIVPFFGGYLAAHALGMEGLLPIFIGATLTATSVGITARVLSDMGKLRTRESRIILGAAVIDDVLGLLILSIVSGLSSDGSGFSMAAIVKTSLLALAFLLGSVILGNWLAQPLLRAIGPMQSRGMLHISAFIFCLLLACLARIIGLAPIIGAFAAGLVLAKTEESAHIREKIEASGDITIPIFFVMMGVSLDPSLLNPFDPASHAVMLLEIALILVAVAGKLASGLGVLEKRVSRLAVGVGMIPRGEVGLIFASTGLARGIIDRADYAVTLVVVVVTTLITPPLLKALFRRVRG
ncbi:MAG: cation:proton antiporter [Armatimonadetes bacterium]|nr:cation:proton antiporter [Armatimonadota bacterium]